jgi:SAM-dependent methyltransferase
VRRSASPCAIRFRTISAPAPGPGRLREIRERGYLFLQPNNDARRVEYPWVSLTAALQKGMRVLEIGGALAGVQCVLSRRGKQVDNVDPGTEDLKWPVTEARIAEINAVSGIAVQPFKSSTHTADLPVTAYDRVFYISEIEHMPPDILAATMRNARRLKPGELFLLSVDRFLNLAPFCSRPAWKLSRNMPVPKIADPALFKLEVGIRAELHRDPEFGPDHILRHLEDYCLGQGCRVLPQMFVLRRSEDASLVPCGEIAVRARSHRVSRRAARAGGPSRPLAIAGATEPSSRSVAAAARNRSS